MLEALLAAVQSDPGGRGLARDPADNLLTATAGDFAAACRSLAEHPEPAVEVLTGFVIPSAEPPALETDGPLGAVFLLRALAALGIPASVSIEVSGREAMAHGLRAGGLPAHKITTWDPEPDPSGSQKERMVTLAPVGTLIGRRRSHYVALERSGPASDGRHYTMRGRDITDFMAPAEMALPTGAGKRAVTVGIGDGGNEVGMGKVPAETIRKNIPHGETVHCRVATDFLIVAGVSNWGAYALAAGMFALKGVAPPVGLFDQDAELRVLQAMVEKGGLVDGVTAARTATVDGLTWDDYAAPLARLAEVLAHG